MTECLHDWLFASYEDFSKTPVERRATVRFDFYRCIKCNAELIDRVEAALKS